MEILRGNAVVGQVQVDRLEHFARGVDVQEVGVSVVTSAQNGENTVFQMQGAFLDAYTYKLGHTCHVGKALTVVFGLEQMHASSVSLIL